MEKRWPRRWLVTPLHVESQRRWLVIPLQVEQLVEAVAQIRALGTPVTLLLLLGGRYRGDTGEIQGRYRGTQVTLFLLLGSGLGLGSGLEG